MKMVWHYKNKILYADQLQFFENLKSRAVKYSDLDRKDIKGIGFFDVDRKHDCDYKLMVYETIAYMMNPVKVRLGESVISNLITQNPESLDVLLSLREVGLKRKHYEKKEAIRKGGFLGRKKIGEKDVVIESFINFYDSKLPKARIEPILKDQIVYPLYAMDLKMIMTYIKIDERY